MATLRTSLVLDLVGNVTARSTQFLRSLRDMGQGGSRAMGVLKRSTEQMGKALDSMANRYTAVLGGAAGAGAIRQVMALEERFTMLKLSANASQDEIEKLKKTIFDTATDPSIRVNPEELLGSVEKIVEVTGNMKLAQDNLKTIGKVMRASSATGEDVAATLTSLFQKFGQSSEEDILRAFDTLRKQGESGAFTIRDLSSKGTRLASAFAAMGYTGARGVQQMGAWAQVAQTALGDKDMATTALESLLKDITAHTTELSKMGIQVWDEKNLAQGRYVARDLDHILNDVLGKVKDPAKLQKLFGEESLRIVSSLKNSDLQTSLKGYLKTQGDGVELTQESAEAAKKLGAALESLRASWARFADASLTAPLEKLADTLGRIDPKTAATGLKVATVGAGALGALVAGRKAYTLGKSAYDTLKFVATGGKSGSVGGLTGAGGGLGGVQPVFVTNWPGSPLGLPGGAGAAAEAGGAVSAVKGLMGKITPAAVMKLGKGAAVLGTAVAGYQMYKTVTDERLTQAQKINRSSGIAGGLGGGLAGGMAGAALGTMILPGIGTAGGMLLGGLAGGFGGDAVGEALARYFTNAQPMKAEVRVGFDNAPPGMRVQQLRTSDNLDLAVASGLRAVKP